MALTIYEKGQLDYSSRISFYSMRSAELLESMVHGMAVINDNITNQSAGKSAGKIDDIPAESIENLGNGLKLIAEASKKLDKNAGKKLASVLNSISTFSNNVKTENLENLEAVSGAMTGISSSVLSFGSSMALATPLLALAYPSSILLSGILKIITPAVTKFGTEEATEGAKNVKRIGISTLAFAGSLYLSSEIAKNIDYTSILSLSTVLAGYGILFTEIGKRDKKIRGGSKSVLFMAGSIATFATITFFTGVIAKNIDYVSTFKILGLIGLNSLVYTIIGKFDKQIVKGSIAVTVLTLSNFLFSLGIKKSTEGLPPFEDVFKLVGMIGILGTTYGVAGRFMMPIIQGSIAVAAMSLSLLILSPGIKSLSETLKNNENIYWQVPALITSMGASFALAGAVTGLILSGSLAMAGTGVALMVIAKGVSMFPSMDEKRAEGIKLSIKSVIEGFGKGFSGLSITEALTLPLKIPVVGAMGLALIPLSLGISMWKNKVSRWTIDDNKLLKGTISSLSEAFATAGSTKGMSKLFGFPVGRNDTERGIDSTMRMGKNLSILSKGILAWKELQITKSDMDLVSSNIQRVLNTIPAIFASIGQRDRKGKSKFSLLGMMFGADFSQGDVESGISSTMKLGQNLKNLSEGIVSWKNMKLSPEDLAIVNQNIQRVLNTIPAIFASIGKRERGDDTETSLFGMVFGTDFSKGDIETGIEATMKLGQNLKNLSEGVLAWKPNGKEGITEESLMGIKKNIGSILDTIPEQFARIGKMDRKTSGWFSSGDVTKGVEIIKGLGNPLQSIAKLMNSVKSINAKKKADEIGMGVRSLLGHLREAAKSEKEAVEIGVSTTDIINQVERISKLAKPMEKLAKSFDKFNKSLKDHISYISKLDEDKLEAFEDWADALEAFAEVDPDAFKTNMGIAKGLNQITQKTTPPNFSTTNNILTTAGDKLNTELKEISGDKSGDKSGKSSTDEVIKALLKEMLKMRGDITAMSSEINRLTSFLMTGTINVKQKRGL